MSASFHYSSMSDGPDDDRQVLLDLIRHLDRLYDPDAMYREVDHALARVVACDRIAVGRVNTATGRITTEYESGASLGLPERYESLPVDQRALTYGVVHQSISVLHTVPEDTDTYRGDAVRRRFGMRQVIVTPIPIDGVTAGVLKLYSGDPARFTQETVDTAETFSRLLGLALAARRPHQADDSQEKGDNDLLDIVARILHAATQSQMTHILHSELAGTTGTSILLFDRVPDGSFVLAEASDTAGVCDSGKDMEEAGETLAQRLPNLLTSTIGPTGVPEGTLFTDLGTSCQPPQSTRDLGNLGDLFNTYAVVIAPLRTGQETSGALVGVWPETTPPDQLNALSRRFLRCTDLVGPALHRAMALEYLEERLAEKETIRRLTDSIARTPRFQDALEIICRTSKLITGLDFVAISETTADHVIWHSVSGAVDASFLHKRLPIPNHILSAILQHRRHVVLEDVRNHPELKPDIMPIHTRENLRSSAVIPVYVNVQLRAIMVLASRRLRTFSQDELSTFHAIAGTIATAIASSDARIGGDKE